MTQDVSKVNVEELTILHDHNVVRVAVSDAQDVCGHTVPGAGQGEFMNGLVKQHVCRVVVF